MPSSAIIVPIIVLSSDFESLNHIVEMRKIDRKTRDFVSLLVCWHVSSLVQHYSCNLPTFLSKICFTKEDSHTSYLWRRFALSYSASSITTHHKLTFMPRAALIHLQRQQKRQLFEMTTRSRNLLS